MVAAVGFEPTPPKRLVPETSGNGGPRGAPEGGSQEAPKGP